jgi:outer membrane protein with beta-barrel domain
MRKMSVLAAALAFVAIPAVAHAQSATSEVQGFGGMTFGSSVLGSSTSSAYGGRIGIGVLPGMQVIVEGGRMTDIKPPLLDLLDFTPVSLRVSAVYGETGVRFIVPTRSAVRPYGEATVGFARLSTDLSGIGGTAGAVIDTGLNFLNRTEPMLGAGAGVLLQGGPLSLDLGYRYNKILAANSVASALNGGRDFNVNQVRVGVGVRF